MNGDPRLSTNGKEGLSAAGHVCSTFHTRLSARLTLSDGQFVGDQLHRVAQSAESSPRFTLDDKSVPRRKGLAAEIPCTGERLRFSLSVTTVSHVRYTILYRNIRSEQGYP